MTKTLKETDYYKSSDMILCAVLCCYGYQVDSIDKQNPSKVIFLIKRDDQLDDLIQQYFTQQLSVEPTIFANYIKNLKTRIYNS